MDAHTAETSKGPEAPAPPRPSRGSAKKSSTFGKLGEIAPSYALVVAFFALIAFFGIERPHAFLSINNAKAILDQAAPLLIVAVGLTILLTMQEFDLSFAAMIGMVAGLVVVLMRDQGISWQLAAVIGVAAGALAGGFNGFLVSYLKGASFITTLAMGTVFTGVEFLITKQENIYEGVPISFAEFAQGRSIFGLSNEIYYAAIIAVLGWLFLQHSETGRYMHAIGSNPEAARLSGVPVRRLRWWGFVILGLTAGFVAVLLTSTATASSPQMGAPYLLPAFAAVFLGSAVFKLGVFNIPGTVLGVLLLGVIETGLSMLSLQTSIINIVQGGILVVAVLMSLARSRATA
jgi:ribose/xylose/arabinose/galactoside ABC-type transport system permease subunit